MKFLTSIVSLILLTSAHINANKHDADLLSVINKMKSINLRDFNEVMKTVSTEVLMFISFFDSACVTKKLGVDNVAQSSIYDIPNLKQFQEASKTNLKIISAIENAARICSRSFPYAANIGITQNIEMREGSLQFIFSVTKDNPKKATECFKWSLAQSKPESPLFNGFDVSSITFSDEECAAATSTEDLSNLAEYKIIKSNIKSCNAETFGQIKTIAGSIFEKYLLSTLEGTPEFNELEADINASAVNAEVQLLEAQIKCYLDDLENE
ncbi:unnamed protein product [Chironomus riparius]|uniref:Uncharacterized protein n=1 Tax=Chironomus riparius TaxID=315576 RepID=A0A9N9RML4_9DIPT|nr:unnamed protein product [Chironomus riparius]